MRRYLIILLLGLLCFSGLRAQYNDSLARQKTFFTRKNCVIIGLTAQQVGSFYLEYKWWWKGDYHPFHLESDGWFNNYSLGIDKLGHFYTSYLYYHSINEIMLWAGFSPKTRLVTSVTFPALYALSVELGDGFSTYDFSFPDLISNYLGIGYGYLQTRVPYLRNFNVKMSYYPSDYTIQNKFRKWSLPEDYDGHIYWLTYDVHNILPKSWQRFWPQYLNLGTGYGVNRFTAGYTNIQREFFIGLDYNLSAIHTRHQTLKTALNILDKFHFPAPGLKYQDEHSGFSPRILIVN